MLYNPPRFKSVDKPSILALIEQNPLATVISSGAISHLPLIVEKRGDSLFLLGHLARANPHCQVLKQAESQKTRVTAIFHGPNAYISPRWYAANDVPTWNYAVVHMRGAIKVAEDAEHIIANLKKLSSQMDSRWEFRIPDDLDGRLTQSISAFEIEVQDIDAKNKLGQNRSAADRAGVSRGLRAERDDDGSLGIADLMDRLKS